MDIIFIHDFRLNILIGIYEWERMVPQTIQFYPEFGIPRGRAGKTDAIADTIYSAKFVARI